MYGITIIKIEKKTAISSNPEKINYISFCTKAPEKGINPSLFSLAMAKIAGQIELLHWRQVWLVLWYINFHKLFNAKVILEEEQLWYNLT